MSPSPPVEDRLKLPAEVGLLGVPWDEGSSFVRGPAQAPPHIRQELASEAWNQWTELGIDLEASPFRDLGDLELTGVEDPFAAIVEGVNHHLGSLGPLGHLDETARRLLCLGGDHAITYPVVRATQLGTAPRDDHPSVGSPSLRWPDLTILQFDAHPDLYLDFDGDPHSNACPFTRILEEGLAQRLVQVGIRTINGAQRTQIERFEVEVVEARHFGRVPIPPIEGPVYISLDLDVLDPAFAPGLSHREPGGLSVRDVLSVLHELQAPIIGADLVEYNPRRDVDHLAATVAAKFVKELAGRMLAPSESQ